MSDNIFPAPSPEQGDEVELYRLATLLHQAAALWRVRLDKRLRPWGMTQTTWRILWLLRMAERSYNQSELAARLGIENPTLVKIIDRMEAKALLKRTADSQDRRQKRIEITDEGMQLALEIEHQVVGIRHEILADLSAEERQAGIAVLDKIVARTAALP